MEGPFTLTSKKVSASSFVVASCTTRSAPRTVSSTALGSVMLPGIEVTPVP